MPRLINTDLSDKHSIGHTQVLGYLEVKLRERYCCKNVSESPPPPITISNLQIGNPLTQNFEILFIVLSLYPVIFFRGGGNIGLLNYTSTQSFITTFSYLCANKILGTFIKFLIGWLNLHKVTIVYYILVLTSIYRPLSYPFTSLCIYISS